MKIAVPAEESSSTSPICFNFENASYLIIYDSEAQTFTTMSNPDNLAEIPISSSKSIHALANAGVSLLLTGPLPSSTAKALEAAGLRSMVTTKTTVEQAIQHYLDTINPSVTSRPIPEPNRYGRGLGGGGQGKGGGGRGRGIKNGGQGLGGGGRGRGIGGGGRGLGGGGGQRSGGGKGR